MISNWSNLNITFMLDTILTEFQFVLFKSDANLADSILAIIRVCSSSV